MGHCLVEQVDYGIRLLGFRIQASRCSPGMSNSPANPSEHSGLCLRVLPEALGCPLAPGIIKTMF